MTQDSSDVFFKAFVSLVFALILIIAGPYIFTWAINTVANKPLLVIDSFWDWFVLAIMFTVITVSGGGSSKK